MPRNTKQTGPKAARAAGKVLGSPKSSTTEKRAAASASAQAPARRRKK